MEYLGADANVDLRQYLGCADRQRILTSTSNRKGKPLIPLI